MKTQTRTLTAAVILLAAAAGCGPSAGPSRLQGETFRTSEESTDVGEVCAAQEAAGQAADGMLHDCDFADARLNGLGKSKLDAIRRGTETAAIAVYLDVPHPTYAARKAAVVAYLRTTHLVDSQVAVAEGPNPASMTPSAYNLTAVYKTDAKGFTGEAADLGVTGGLGANGPGGTVGK